MASCTQVEGSLQAYIDDELPPSERVILEQHVAECSHCAGELAKHQRCAALLFESFAPARFHGDLCGSVRENLPEMAQVKRDMRGVNWRAKHPQSVLDQMARFAPLAVGVFLLVLGVVIKSYWPGGEQADTAIGIVGQAAGEARCVEAGTVARLPVHVKDYVQPEARYETDANSNLLLMLTGRTTLKLSPDSRIRLYDERKLALEKGRIWLEVGKDARLFKVLTPSGEITVFGTIFDVKVNDDSTTVTVARGQVQVENQKTFGLLEPGEQVNVSVDENQLKPRKVDADKVVSWSNDISADADASRAYEELLSTRDDLVEIPAEKVFVVDTSRGKGTFEVQSLRLEWQPEKGPVGDGYCSYDVYVSDQKLQPLFKGRIDGSVFADREHQWYDLAVADGPIKNRGILHIKVIPDYSSGHEEADFTRVYGIGTH